jgi:excisionase family DNA binding protein
MPTEVPVSPAHQSVLPPARGARNAKQSPTTQLALVVTPNEFAAALKVSRRTIIRMIDSGRIRAFKVEKCVRIPRSELERFLASDARVA